MSRFDGYLRDLGPVDPEALVSVTNKLAASEELWSRDETRYSTLLPRAQHIVFKFPDDYPNSHRPASYRPVWSEWAPLLAPIIDEVIARLGLGPCETAKIMFTRLNAGGQIPTHVDENLSSLVPRKIHVPLITHPKVIFRVCGEPYHLPVGRAYELNNLLPHSVHNDSEGPRVHLIFDSYPVAL